MRNWKLLVAVCITAVAVYFTGTASLSGTETGSTSSLAQQTEAAAAAIAQDTAAAANAMTANGEKAAEETEKKAEAAVETAEAATSQEAPAEEAHKNRFSGNLWALVPPVVAIILALITKEVYSSLFVGILLGGCFVGEFHPLKVVDAVINDGLIAAVSSTAGIFIFLVMLGNIVALINLTGATAAFGRWAQSRVKSRAGTMLATFLLGVMIFVDDYFNCLTVGSVMLPVTDAKRISRAKLAYLIDATAAPICMIAPISSWAAAVSQYAEGTEFSGLELFIRAIPYNFYSLLTFVFIIGITLLKVDFGPMALHERNAIENGDLFTSGGEVDNGIRTKENARGRVADMVIPVLFLIVVCVFALVYVGGILDGKDFISAFSDTDATVGLPWGGVVAVVFTVIYLVLRRVITFKEAMSCSPSGFNAMVPAILILSFATALKNMTTALEAKEFIASLMQGSASNLNMFLPAVIFFVACVLAFSTGTSWGTFGILIPIVVNIFPATSQLLFIGMSACLAGAVCGDHCSPISDTTIMSSAGARCEHLNHVSTQLPYSITVAVVSFIGFLIAGLVQNWFVVFPIMVAIMLGLLVFVKLFFCQKSCAVKKA